MFVGIGLGFSDDFSQREHHVLVPNWSLIGGYEYKPLREIGLMAYLESIIGINPAGLQTSIKMQIAINTDIAVELALDQRLRLGPYIGLGIGYLNEEKYLDDGIRMNKALLLLNLGLQTNIENHHVIRVSLRYPYDLAHIREDMHLVLTSLSYAYKF